MKTTEMMMQSLNERKRSYDEKRKIQKRRLSVIAAFAAAVIVITAIPVGSIMIANRANQPIEAPGFDTDLYTTDTERVNNTNILDLKTPFISKIMITENHLSNITDMTVTDADPSKQPGVMRSYKEGDRFLYINEGLDGNIPVDGGLLRRTNALFAHEFTDEADNYQLDVVFTDGANE
ncbi:MAG: hypothetical protein II777_02230, partial [Clostridia bacterium]|nr:hypothetical protein [Clostridia bacterium]